jgi:hypothetical protein
MKSVKFFRIILCLGMTSITNLTLATESTLSQEDFYKIVDSVNFQKQIEAVKKANAKVGVHTWLPETREGEKADEKNKLELLNAEKITNKIKYVNDWKCSYQESPEDLIAQLNQRKSYAEINCIRNSTNIYKSKFIYILKINPEYVNKIKKIYRNEKLTFSGEINSMTSINANENYIDINVDKLQVSK